MNEQVERVCQRYSSSIIGDMDHKVFVLLVLIDMTVEFFG